MAPPTPSPTPGGGRSVGARVLAALGLVACGVAIFAVVSGSMSDSDSDGGLEREREPRSERVDRPEPEPEPEAPEDTYTVAAGDTLTSISDATGVSLPRLQRLNPDLDTATINVGQVVLLRPE